MDILRIRPALLARTMLLVALFSFAAGCGSEDTTASELEAEETETQEPAGTDEGTEAGDATEAEAPAELTKITQAVPTLDFGFLPITFTKAQGYFEDEGLDVEIVAMRSNAAIPALTSKEIEFASAGSSVRAALQGAPLKAVMYSYYEATLIGVAASEIESYDDLRGKSIAVSAPGSSEDLITKALLEEHGISPDEVNIIPAGRGGDRVAALQSGQVQYSLLNPDLAVVMEGEGFNLLGDAQGVWPVPWSGFAVHEDTLTERPDMVKAWLRALIRGITEIVENPDAAVQFAVDELDMDEAAAQKAVDLVVPFINEADIGGWTHEAMVRAVEVGMEEGDVSGDPEEMAEKVHHIELLREAQQELGVGCSGGWKCDE